MKNPINKFLLVSFLLLSVATLNAQPGKSHSSGLYSFGADGRISGYLFPQLPYAYEALQPYIDSLTMYIHYDRHHRAYYSKFTASVKESGLEGKSMEEIFTSVSKYSESIRNNGGGYYNHFIFWANMAPSGSSKPGGEVLKAIEKKFGSLDKFKEQFGNAAKGKFGSGWAWLILDSNRELQISTTSNQDNPLMDVADKKGQILLALDVWEHAYYLKYQNKRADYVDAFWNVVNWDEVNRRYLEALKTTKSSMGYVPYWVPGNPVIQKYNTKYLSQYNPGC